MRRLTLLLCFLVAACAGPTTEPPGPTMYHQGAGAELIGCKPQGFDFVCRGP
jgi:hypothetical protein